MERLARKDKRVRIMFRPKNGGIVAASQDALDFATGEFIAFLDNDDTLHPNSLNLVSATLDKDATIDYVYSDENKLDENDRTDIIKSQPSLFF